MINKSLIKQALIEQLEASLAVAVQSAKHAHQDATHEQSKAETQYDSLGIEMAYLAEGQSKRIEALRQEIQVLKESIEPISNQKIQLGHLIKLENCDDESVLWVYILAVAGGNKVTLNNVDIQIVTPSAPIAKKLLKQSIDDIVSFDWQATEYEIIEVV